MSQPQPSGRRRRSLRALRTTGRQTAINKEVCGKQFDRSGTTHIGKYVINHSFILPGLIGVATSCLVGYLIAAARGLAA
jgi:hypothetical protein